LNTKQQNRCVFCGSVAYGKGCKFGPHQTHFHTTDSTKCSYCGSTSFGKGCKLNPTSDLHVHGAVFNNMHKEHIQSFLDHRFLIEKLKTDYTKFRCYELGIIDESGNKIKEPVTEEEQNSFSPFVKTLLRIKKYLGPKMDLLDAQHNLSKHSIPITEDMEKYKKLICYRDKIDNVVNELYKVIEEACNDDIPLESIKKLIKA
jgi:hypothetical protein